MLFENASVMDTCITVSTTKHMGANCMEVCKCKKGPYWRFLNTTPGHNLENPCYNIDFLNNASGVVFRNLWYC